MTLPLLGAGRTFPAPATESIRPDAGTLVGDALLDGDPTVAAALSDSDAASYVYAGAPGDGATISFPDLASAFGRDIASFTVVVNAQGDGGTATAIPTIAGLALTGTTSQTLPGSPGNVTYGPFTKSGGGNITVAQMNTVEIALAHETGGFSVWFAATLTGTYA